MKPEISFIVPTYKRPIKLLRCLTSIRDFVSLSCEIIVIDDSQDGEGFTAANKAGATYIKKSSVERRGLASNRNIGLNFAKGDFIVFIDDDDFFVGDDIGFMVKNAESHDMVCGNHFEFYEHAPDESKFKTVKTNGFRTDDMLVYNRLPPGSYAIRRDAIKYKFDEEMRSHEDWDFLLRNMFDLKVKHFDRFVIAMDKTENNTASHMAQTRNLFWMDFLAVYSRFPCPRLSQQRSDMLKTLGINFPSQGLEAQPYINQRVY